MVGNYLDDSSRLFLGRLRIVCDYLGALVTVSWIPEECLSGLLLASITHIICFF